MKRVDAMIVGGGPAGAATALALQRIGRRALLVEQGAYDECRGFDTLAAQALRPLAALGLSEASVATGHRPCHLVQSAWADAEPREQSALFSRYGPSWHIERRRFDEVLAHAAAEAGAGVWTGARPVGVGRTKAGWQAQVERGGRLAQVHAEVLVDATGRAARLVGPRRGARLSYDRMIGITALLEPRRRGQAEGTRLLLEATGEGWWYSSPLPDGRLLACHVTDADLVRRSGTLARCWRRALEQAPYTQARTSHYRAPGEGAVSVRPAGVGRMSPCAGPGWIAVGDAAATVDPLSGAGVAAALESGLAAARAIAAAAEGDAAAFARYDRAAVDGFAAHLKQRAIYYGRVERFADRLFWRRRRPIDPWRSAITLDPLARLAAAAPSGDRSAAARLEGLLPRQDLARLRQLCAVPDAAHHIVAAFRGASVGGADDRAAIVALQVMIEDRLLHIIQPGGRA